MTQIAYKKYYYYFIKKYFSTLTYYRKRKIIVATLFIFFKMVPVLANLIKKLSFKNICRVLSIKLAQDDFNINSSKKALEVLDATPNNYRQRYKQLIRINHPDRGGSDFICSKITESYKYLEEYY